MQNRLVWPVVVVVCASIIALGIYYGLQDDDQAGPSQTSSLEGGRVKSDSSTEGITVYATRTGQCYHRGSCSYLRRSKIPMPLSEAKVRYRPCSRCRPPQ